MSFGGGGFFGSGATQQENPVATGEVGQQTADQSSAFGVSGISQGQKSSLQIITGDYGAIGQAFNFADHVQEAANQAREDSLSFGAGALEYVGSALNAGYDGLLNTVDKSIQSSDAARNDALQFAAGSITATQGAVEDALHSALESNKSAQENSYEFSAGAINKSLDLVNTNTNAVLKQVADSTSNTLASLAQAQTDTITAIANAQKGEAAASFDKLVKVAGWAFAGIVAIMIFKGAK